jgi:hypothetical protein
MTNSNKLLRVAPWLALVAGCAWLVACGARQVAAAGPEVEVRDASGEAPGDTSEELPEVAEPLPEAEPPEEALPSQDAPEAEEVAAPEPQAEPEIVEVAPPEEPLEVAEPDHGDDAEAATTDAPDATEEEAAAPPCPACQAYGAVTTIGELEDQRINEISGLAASRLHPGLYYAHNDSGDSARFFALDASGATRGEFQLAQPATAVDWEDLAVGPCALGSCVYLGDVGDNFAQRDDYVVYVVPEPVEWDDSQPVVVNTTAYPFRYPDGPHNCETMLVHPVTGDIYLVTKGSTWSVYKLPTPHTPGVQAVLEPLGTAALASAGQVATGGSVHPCGTRALIRSYGSLWEYRLGEGQAFDQLFQNPPTVVPVANHDQELQGESVGYQLDGLGYLTVSEGQSAAIHRVRCQD